MTDWNHLKIEAIERGLVGLGGAALVGVGMAIVTGGFGFVGTAASIAGGVLFAVEIDRRRSP